MKFGELTVLFLNEIDKVIANDHGENKTLRFIIIAYNNVVKKLSESFTENELVTDARINSLEISLNMKNKLINFSKQKVTKKLKEQQKAIKFKQELTNLIGIGNKKVDELIKMGLTNVKQLYTKKYFSTLNMDTQMTLTHNPVRLINWEDVNKIEKKLTGFNKYITLVGSYRRKKPTVRDIDILFLSDKNNTIEKYISYLNKEFDNKIYFYSSGPQKTSLILQPGSDPKIKYKADIFITTKENYYTTLLYTTGSKFNNIRMRARAKRLNLLLNQNGIFDNNKKKINKDTDDEKKLFALLDLEYLEPEQRF